MQLADRGEFVAQLKTLCAGFNVPFTGEREEAYWRGLERMQVSSFARVVTHALSDHGPEKLPTVRDVWSLSRVLRRQQPPMTDARDAPPPPAVDHWTAFANRRLAAWLRQYGPLSDASLARVVAEKRRLTEQFRLIASDDVVTEEEFTDALRRAWNSAFTERSAAEIEADRQRTCVERGLRFEPRRAS